MRFLFISILFFLFTMTAHSQDSLSYEEQYLQEYQKRIQKSHINGFYIPDNLKDAIRILDEIVDEPGRRKFASQVDTTAVNKVFFSFGRWININWGMEQGSRLTVSLNKHGVSYPDDMTRLIMYAYHHHLNKQPYNIDSLVEKVIQERLDKEKKARNAALDKP